MTAAAVNNLLSQNREQAFSECPQKKKKYGAPEHPMPVQQICKSVLLFEIRQFVDCKNVFGVKFSEISLRDFNPVTRTPEHCLFCHFLKA